VNKVISMPDRPPKAASRTAGVRDRRYTIRYPFAADALLIHLETGQQVTGVTSDISLGGCFICTSRQFPPKSRARLRLSRKGQELECLVTVRIVKPKVGLGVEFFDLERPNDTVLANWIDSQRRSR
jgi:hypothetical protein